MKRTNRSTRGTSFQGVTVQATFESIIEKIKEPDFLGEPTDNIDMIWDCETDDGEVFTIYNMADDIDMEINFRIGSFSESISLKAKEEILVLLNS